VGKEKSTSFEREWKRLFGLQAFEIKGDSSGMHHQSKSHMITYERGGEDE